MRKTIGFATLCLASAALAADDPAMQEPTVVMKTMTVMGEKTEVPVVVAPSFLPTYKEELSAEDAAKVLALTQPVIVTNTAAFEDGGTVTAVLVDSKGKTVSFRRSPWNKTPVYYFIDSPTPDGKPRKLAYDGKELKAISVLALLWVDKAFTKEVQARIREKQDGRTRAEDDAGQMLWLFRPKQEK
jgi:hypothetical protein